MSKKVKIKVKDGKAKIKMKGGHEPLPLEGAQLQQLLGAVVYAAANAPATRALPPPVEEPEEVRLLAAGPKEPAS